MFKVFSTRDGKPFSHAVKGVPIRTHCVRYLTSIVEALRIIWEHFPQFGPENTAHVDDLVGTICWWGVAVAELTILGKKLCA